MPSIQLLSYPHREESSILEMLVIAEVCQRFLRKYQTTLESKDYLPPTMKTMLLSDYPYPDKLSQRDIRHHMGSLLESSYYGVGDLQRSMEWTLDYIRLQFRSIGITRPDNFIEISETILDEIRTDVANRFCLADKANSPTDLSSDPMYNQAIAFVCDAMQLGSFFADIFYIGLEENTRNNPNDQDLRLGTRLPGASMQGRPVLCTAKVSSSEGKAVYFNCRAFNAYFQRFLFFLFYHEITAHLWSNLRPLPSTDIVDCPPLAQLDVFEEAFVHWVAIYYLKSHLFSDLMEPNGELIERLKISKEMPNKISFSDLSEAFEVYERYFQIRYEYDERFKRACKTARGLRACIQLFVCEHRGDTESSWECMRGLVTGINSLQLPPVEKNELINTLYYLVAPLGEKYTWYDMKGQRVREIEVDKALYDVMRQETKTLLQKCQSGGNQVDAWKMVEQVRELDRLERIDQIIKTHIQTLYNNHQASNNPNFQLR